MAAAPADVKTRFPEAFLAWLDGRRIEEVECIVPDVAGMSRGKAMPWAKFAREDRMFLPTSIFHQTISGDYVDMHIDNQWTESDMVLRPDYATATAAPWADDVTLQVIHNVEDLDGRPVPVAPRNVLKRVLELYAAEGWAPVVAPEMEFYLIKPNLNPNEPIEPPLGRTGRQMVSRQAYSMSAVDEYGKVIDDIYDFAEAQGFELDTIIQEGGAGQVEINFLHGDPLKLADQVFFFKRTIREAALRNNCFATFMAKPMQDEPGSAMHIHHSVVDTATGATSSPVPKTGRRHFSRGSSPGCSATCRAWSACSRPTSTATAASSRAGRHRSTSNGGRTTAPPASACRSRRPPAAASRTASSAWTATPISRSQPRSPAAIWA
jgi:glutamine synthetase